jgi:lysophospholipase L1-like esterase
MKKIFIVLFLFCLCACTKQEITNYPAKEGPIVAFGDSLTYGQGVSAKDAYPALLEKMWNRKIINLGISGNTSLQGLARKEEIKEFRPSFVLIEFSANDLFKKVPREQTQKALEDIVDYVQNLGAVAVLIDTGGNTLMKPYRKMIKKIAKEKKTLYVNGIMDGIFSKKSLKSDTLHPNEKGYEIIARKIDKALKPYL